MRKVKIISNWMIIKIKHVKIQCLKGNLSFWMLTLENKRKLIYMT